MAADMDVLASALRDLNLANVRNIVLKPEQESAVRALLAGRDVLAVLPTGYGKSLIYQMFVRAKNHELLNENQCDNAAILVISPLKSIIEDQLQDLESWGYPAAYLSKLSSDDLEKCDFKILFATAEQVKEKHFREMLLNSTSKLHQNVWAIVVDESHTVETWTGKRKNSKSGNAFRKAYGELAVLRSLCKEGTPTLALTGTADDTTKNTICSELTLKEDVLKIFISPHRVNIRISVKYVKKEVMGNQIEWLVEEVKEKGEATPKTIIFCNTLKDIATVVNLLFFKLGKHATVPVGSSDNDDFIIGIFHSVSWPKMKEKLLGDFRGQSKKRIIVASTALSMGVNFGDVRYVINWGPARNILDQIQEAGRAGRDGNKSHLIVIYHGNQLSYCEDEVKVFVKSEGCYRVALYKTFDQEIQPVNPGHDCCSHCALKCCNKSCTEVVPFETPYVAPVSSPALTRPVCEEDKADIRAAFTGLVEENNDNAFGATSKHAFSKELVNGIVKNCHRLFTVRDVFECLPVFSLIHCMKILEIIQEMFGDLPHLDNTCQLFADNMDVSSWEPEYFEGYFDEAELEPEDLDNI